MCSASCASWCSSMRCRGATLPSRGRRAEMPCPSIARCRSNTQISLPSSQRVRGDKTRRSFQRDDEGPYADHEAGPASARSRVRNALTSMTTLTPMIQLSGTASFASHLPHRERPLPAQPHATDGRLLVDAEDAALRGRGAMVSPSRGTSLYQGQCCTQWCCWCRWCLSASPGGRSAASLPATTAPLPVAPWSLIGLRPAVAGCSRASFGSPRPPPLRALSPR
jgi:hypothetical protein